MNKRYPISIHTGDVHLTDVKPIARVDEPDWFQAQFRVLDWLHDLQKSKRTYDFDEPYIISGGDLFDKVKLSNDFLNRCYDCFLSGRWVTLLGNHEQPNKNSDVGMYDSVWTIAKRMGMFSGIQYQGTVCICGRMFAFIPATNSEEEFMKSVEASQKAHVVVLHKYVWAFDDDKYVGASNKNHAKYIASLFPNAKVVFTSDNHHGFEYTETTPKVYNCGMLIRDNADLINYQPRVYILYDDYSVERVDVPIADDLITDRHIKVRKEAEEAEEVFIRTLGDSKDISLSFEDNLRIRLDKQPSMEYVMSHYNKVKENR